MKHGVVGFESKRDILVSAISQTMDRKIEERQTQRNPSPKRGLGHDNLVQRSNTKP